MDQQNSNSKGTFEVVTGKESLLQVKKSLVTPDQIPAAGALTIYALCKAAQKGKELLRQGKVGVFGYYSEIMS